MIYVVAASSTVACGGRRELPKSPGLCFNRCTVTVSSPENGVELMVSRGSLL